MGVLARLLISLLLETSLTFAIEANALKLDVSFYGNPANCAMESNTLCVDALERMACSVIETLPES